MPAAAKTTPAGSGAQPSSSSVWALGDGGRGVVGCGEGTAVTGSPRRRCFGRQWRRPSLSLRSGFFSLRCSPSNSCSGSDEWQTTIDDRTSADSQPLSRVGFLSLGLTLVETLSKKPRTPATSLRQFFPLRPP
ncbi:hypothetical protein BT93_I1737 [Corymbia citriodora subsp. variegata]|nr:hypothetical protein BT93_I1737 [Corymbia citriodora subsp. variegata]